MVTWVNASLSGMRTPWLTRRTGTRRSHQKPAKVVGIVTVEIDSPALHESGLMYQQQPHWMLRFRGGKLIQAKEYLDTQLVIDVLCGGRTVAPAALETTPSTAE
jgi:ketosteroid isomerase-like protein